MEPITLIIVLVQTNCQNWDYNDVFNESYLTFYYLRDYYRIPMNDMQIYCAEPTDLSSKIQSRVYSWADRPHAIVLYLFRDAQDHPSFSESEELNKIEHEGGHAYCESDHESYRLSLKYYREHKNTLCTVFKAQVRLALPDEWVTESYDSASNIASAHNVLRMTHEVSHAILMYLDYPVSISTNWVHEHGDTEESWIRFSLNDWNYVYPTAYPWWENPISTK